MRERFTRGPPSSLERFRLYTPTVNNEHVLSRDKISLTEVMCASEITLSRRLVEYSFNELHSGFRWKTED